MQIRCYRCGWSFAIKREEAAFALQALEETKGTHYDSNCPRCRHSNRISLEQLRKAVPRSATEPETSAQEGDQETTEAREPSDQDPADGASTNGGDSEAELQEKQTGPGEPDPAE